MGEKLFKNSSYKFLNFFYFYFTYGDDIVPVLETSVTVLKYY